MLHVIQYGLLLNFEALQCCKLFRQNLLLFFQSRLSIRGGLLLQLLGLCAGSSPLFGMAQLTGRAALPGLELRQGCLTSCHIGFAQSLPLGEDPPHKVHDLFLKRWRAAPSAGMLRACGRQEAIMARHSLLRSPSLASAAKSLFNGEMASALATLEGDFGPEFDARLPILIVFRI